ncbi:MAG: bifunctional tetrahydrofolate synthase/dihydrofolate synthase [bacterium]|nr:bifunctional tetrahydrofolate synthase/dihydrofolate synthase [bacterium]
MTAPLSLNEWLALLETRHPRAIDMGLERVGLVADRLGVRDLGCPVISVAGTNGKGSTVATLVSIYRAAGLKTGSYTSPHLQHFNERICIDGTPVDNAALVRAFEKVEAAQADISLTYFEFTTLAALVLFREAALDIAVLEVGLGGRLDAVNLVDADVAVVTSIGIDHVEYLGDTREKIAIEKAGIFRRGKAAVCGDRNPPETLLAAARSAGVELSCRPHDFDFRDEGDGWAWHDKHRVLTGLPKPAVALDNAATALAALFAAPVTVSETALREGLHRAALPGRLQTMATAPLVLLDVAHNPHGAAFLMQQLAPAQTGQRTFAVFAMLADKDIAAVIDACLGHIDRWYVADLAVPRGARAECIVPLLLERGAHVAGTYNHVAPALASARQQASAGDRILVFGSFHTVAAAQVALALQG